MSVFIIVMYLTAVISVLLGVAGFIMLIYGLIVKNKKLTISGSIFTGVAIILIISGVFCITARATHLMKWKIKNGIEYYNNVCHPGGHEWMEMDTTMCDTTMCNEDSMSIQMKLKCDNMKMLKCIKKMKCCKIKNCDPAMCRKICEAEKK